MFHYVRVYSPRKWRPLREKKNKYTSSHLPGFMFIFALCFLNEPLYGHAIFLPFFIVECSSLSTIKDSIHPHIIDYPWSPRHSQFFATPFAGIISGLGIICGLIWGSFAVPGSFAGLYSTRNETRVNALRASSFCCHFLGSYLQVTGF